MGGTQDSLTTAPRTVEPDRSWRHRHWPSRTIGDFVISFPKSGRTWLRILMAVVEARARGEETEPVVHEWLAREAPRLGERNVLFTHALSANERERETAMSHFLGYIGDRRRLFLLRDPRDTMVSYYFQVTMRRAAHDRGELGRFIRDPAYGIDRLLAFHRACDQSLRSDPGPAMLASYEELHADPGGCLRSVLEFFGADPTEAALREAVEFGRFENMRRLELERAYVEPNRRLLALDPRDPESLKTRRGVVGGHREYLSERDLAYVEERIAALMPLALGYREPGVPPSSWVGGDGIEGVRG